MTYVEINFGARGRGQQTSNGPKNQPGALKILNADNNDGAASKRSGARVVSLARSDDPVDLITDPRAISSRGPEVVLFTDSELYAHQQCGLSNAGTAGTATPAEISDALAAVDERAATTRTIDVPLPGSATAASTRTRLDRVDVPTTPVVITPSGRSISTVLSTDGTTITWTMTEGADMVTGELTGTIQRLARIGAVTIPPQVNRETEAFRIAWISQVGSIATLLVTTLVIDSASPDLRVFPESVSLATLRGTAAGASYETEGGAIAAFTSGGVLNVWEFEDLSSVQSYAVASPPSVAGEYAVDVSAVSFPILTTGLAVAWAGSVDGIARAAQLKTDDSTVLSQMSYSGILTGSLIQIAIFDAPAVTWDLADRAGSQVSSTRMVWRFNPLDTAIRAIDLPAGADMRMKFVRTATDGAEYDISDATTTNQLYPQRAVQGISGAIDAQWGPQTDTIYGVLTSDTGGFYEVLWERTAEVAALLVDAAVFSAAMAVSANRLTATYWTEDTQLRIIRRTTIASGAVTVAFIVASGVGVTGNVISAAVEFEDAASTVTMGSATWRDDGQVLSLYVREFSSEIFLERVDPFPEVPTFAAEIQGSAGIGPFRIIFSVQYASGSQEVYESSTDVFVRVSPALEVRAGGDWADRGAWTKTKLRSDVIRHHGTRNVVSADAATVLNNAGVPCTFVASEVPTPGGGALADVISTHNEAQIVLDATGKRPRVSPFDDRRLAVSFESASRELVTGKWSPGSAISFTPTGHTLLAERSWDQASFITNGESAVVLAAADDFGVADAISFHIYPDISPVLNLSAATGVTTIVDVGVSARALPDGVSVQLAWGVVGYTAPGTNNQLVAGVVEVNLDTLAVNFLFSRSVPYPNGTAVEPVAVSVDSRDGIAVESWVELEGPINRHVEVVDVDAIKHVPLTQWKRCALVSQLAPLKGSVVGAISLLGTSDTDPDVTDDTFVGGKAYRDGIILLSARTDERVGRVGIGEVEDYAERLLRVPKTGLNIGPDGRLDLGWQETDLDVGSARAPTLVKYSWTPDASAREPAVLNDIMVGAHGGYPRMYDGQVIGEHDFHELPEIVKVAVVGAGLGLGLAAGLYSFAVTFESYDSTGLLYRSRPTFAGPFTLMLDDVLNVTTRDLTQTERPEVRAVLWRTAIDSDGNQSVEYYREIEALATLPPGTDATLTSLSLKNALLIKREQLDQGDQPGDVIPADPIAITNFTAATDGRIWGVSPRDRNAVYYTVANRAGKAAHWSLAQIIQADRPDEITAITQMGSRIALVTRLNASGFYTPGPSSVGLGSFTNPEIVLLAIGTPSNATLARIPEGTVYGAARRAPPQLLTGGWTLAPIGADLDEAYRSGDNVAVGIAFVQASNTLHVIGATEQSTHQLNLESHTWSTDTFRNALDLTVRSSGQLVILAVDGRVLFEEQDLFSSGGAGYITSARSRWIECEGRHELEGNFGELRVIGTYRGAHTLRINLRIDFREEIIETVIVPAATLAAHFAAGREYVYGYKGDRRCGAVSVEVTDDGPPNESFALEQIVIVTSPAETGQMPALRELQSDQWFVANL